MSTKTDREKSHGDADDKMLKNITLKYRMILGGIVAVFIPFFISGIIVYFYLSKSLIEITNSKSLIIVEDISGLIEATIMQEIKLASAIAATPDIVEDSVEGDYFHIQKDLESIHKRIGRKEFTIFVTDKHGISKADAVFQGQIGLNLSDRNYFLKAIEGKTSVAGPLLPRGNVAPGQPIFVVSAPIQKDDQFYGIVALAFNSSFIVNIILNKRVLHTGYAYIVDSEGLILFHPRKELMLNFRLLDQPGLEEMREVVESKKTGTASYTFEGVEKIAGLTSMNLTDWTVVFAQNKDEIMSPVNKILLALLMSGITFLIITIAFIIVFSGKISNPIQEVMEMMRQVTQHSTEIILQIGLDRKIIYANPAFEKISGVTAEDLIGDELDLTNTNNIPEKVIWDSLEAGTPWSGRIIVQSKKPDSVTLDVILIPIRNDHGVMQGYLEIGRDITAELMFEKRLQQSQKLEAIGTLAGGIAHDFNNILSGIFGYAELSMMKKTYDNHTEEYLREIIKASERARDLISQILTFSRQAEVEFRPLLPKTVLKEALKLLRASIPATINIQSNINSDSAIMAEPTQIHRIVMNLFTNAVHAIGDHTGTIKLELEDFYVDEEFKKMHPNINNGDHVIIRISDTGKGIEPELLDQIFEPFFTTKSQEKGTGLGLSVVHGIVKKIKGIITAYSEVGKGAIFNIIIPVTEVEDSKINQNDSTIKAGTERVAVIDDEIAITTTMQSILTNFGYKVTAFTDSVEALETLKTNPDNFDIIVTDYTMPKITGLEIAKTLMEAGINIPVVLISGYIGDNIENAARSIGVSELVTKPINSYQLTDAIKRALKENQCESE